MKKILMLVVIFVVPSLIHGEELYYYGDGKKIYLRAYKDVMAVKQNVILN